MFRYIPLILFALFLSLSIGCSTSQLSKSGTEEIAFVKDFLQTMIEVRKGNYDRLDKFIDPTYYTKNSISKDGYEVDNFTLVGYEIESYSNGVVTTLIWGDDRAWTHRLQFKLKKTNEGLFILPSKHDTGVRFVTPWWNDERYVEQ